MLLGGGSFLDMPLVAKHHTEGACAPTFYEPIFQGGLGNPTCPPIAYVGVGCGSTKPINIHPDHEILIRHAKFIALRSDSGIAEVSKFNTNTLITPDLVYSLVPNTRSATRTPAQKHRVLFLPNINCVPKYDSPAWKHKAWEHYRFEFGQFLDHLIIEGYSIDYMPMSTHPAQLDEYAMIELKNLMHSGHLISLRHAPFPGYPFEETDLKPLLDVFSDYGVIVSQRYHGCVLSEIARTPFLSIVHHDKLRSTAHNDGVFTDYYACSKRSLINAFEQTIALQLGDDLPIDWHSFDELKGRIIALLE